MKYIPTSLTVLVGGSVALLFAYQHNNIAVLWAGTITGIMAFFIAIAVD